MRERAAGKARTLARVIPADARVVGLVYPEGGAGRTATAAAGLAAAVGLRREHTLLVGTEAGRGSLDERLGVARSPGLFEALRGKVRFSELAVRLEGKPYLYLPAGAGAPTPAELLAGPEFTGFARRVRARGGTLLIHVPEEAVREGEVASLLDGYVSLGTLRGPVPAAREYGRVRFPGQPGELPGEPVAAPYLPSLPGVGPARAGSGAPAAAAETAGTGSGGVGEAAPAPEAAPREAPRESAPAAPRTVVGVPDTDRDRWGRHRAKPRLPVLRSVSSAALILLLLAAWWILAGRTIGRVTGTADPGALPPGGPGVGERDGATPAGREGAETEMRGTDPGGGFGEADAGLLGVVESAPELPYSVLIASYARAADATEAVASMRRGRGTVFFTAPTPVRGLLYHRVFAGAVGTRADARSLMEDLVRSGTKASVGEWDVRPSRLAYRLGIAPRRAAAEEILREAEAAGIPAYLVTAEEASGSVWVVYAGGYESEDAARAMGALLERAGRAAELVTRRGEAR
ncbi:MAG: SPOR domain-containing protein [Gemmatimonadota bacterium]